MLRFQVHPRLFWQQADPPGGGDPPKADDPPKGDPPVEEEIEGASDKAKSAIKAARQERDTYKQSLTTLQEERDALAKKVTDQEEADRKKADDEAASKGEFEKLATKRTEERDKAVGEVATLKAENDQYKTALESGLKTGWDALPEAVRKLWKGDDDDVLGKYVFMSDPDTVELVTALTEKETARGNGPNPKTTGDGKTDVAAAQKSQQPIYSNF